VCDWEAGLPSWRTFPTGASWCFEDEYEELNLEVE
jgi:hypothetical protein